MDQKQIGKIILTLRKERKLTQQELGDLLGVSSKTISKWECGYGLPDITILNKISQELGITVDELLSGKIKNKSSKNNNHIPQIIIIISLLILLIISIIIVGSKLKEPNKKHQSDNTTCTIIRTYNIENIGESNDGNYRYITITEFQVEGVFTIKLPKSISDNLEENKAYEFTFEAKEDYHNTNELFNNSDILDIKYTDKVGMERTSISYCN